MRFHVDNSFPFQVFWFNAEKLSFCRFNQVSFFVFVKIQWEFSEHLRVELPFGTCLLEVKPAILATEFRKPCRKITRSGWTGPALVVGSQLLKAPDKDSDLTLYGSLAAEDGGWSRVGRGRWPAAWGEYPFDAVALRWVTAGNQVQWRKPEL